MRTVFISLVISAAATLGACTLYFGDHKPDILDQDAQSPTLDGNPYPEIDAGWYPWPDALPSDDGGYQDPDGAPQSPDGGCTLPDAPPPPPPDAGTCGGACGHPDAS
jgi:hypothetical protein